MLSSASIAAIRDEATERAREQGLVPTTITLEAIKNWPPYPFPSLGDYLPAGWRKARSASDEWLTVQVDKTGKGDGLSLGVKELNARLTQLAKTGDTWGVGIIEEGEFARVLGLFKPAYGDFTQSGLLTDQERRDVLAGTPYGRNK